MMYRRFAVKDKVATNMSVKQRPPPSEKAPLNSSDQYYCAGLSREEEDHAGRPHGQLLYATAMTAQLHTAQYLSLCHWPHSLKRSRYDTEEPTCSRRCRLCDKSIGNSR